MNDATDVLTRPFLNKTIGECSVQEIKNITQTYPYFAPAQLALLKKLKQDALPEFNAQLQKSVLYYYDPLQFEAFIHSEKFVTHFDFSVAGNKAQAEEELHKAMIKQIQINESQKVTEEVQPIITKEPAFDQQPAAENVPVEKDFSDDNKILADDEENATTEKVLPNKVVTEELPEQPEITEERNSEAEEISLPATENEPASDTEVPPTLNEEKYLSDEEDQEEQSFPQKNILSSSASPLLNAAQTEPANDSLIFEPYHTVDYFASQGIKLSAQTPTDKVGKQLKSFTQWLKTMKKLPAAEQIKNLDQNSEHKVQNLAAHSLETTDIVTETMAEVWLKQGNKEKAMEVYNKLSLQNPSKKAYFAAKIENLKQSS